jgi:MinD-like ATPase involved in chromosome partitioning or flagellar assembly
MTVVVVRSSKGGVGRTSVTALLGCALARRGSDVAVMDLDRQDALRLYCGEINDDRPAFEGGRLQLTRASGGFSRVAQDPATCALLLGGGPLSAHMAPRLLAPWLGTDRILIVDMAASEDAAAAMVADLAGLHLRLFLPDPGSLAKLAEPSGDATFARSAFLLNQADRRRPLTESAASFLRHVAGARFAGEIRRDEAVPEACAALKPLPDYEPASAAWRDIETVAAELELRFAAAARFEASHASSDSNQTARLA